ncbi:hypothetical protein CYMTET_55616 [Cymbomonas tetramitiformis]|uniref:Uncharacterized protein n=1 Tax=Cymbomonas tetramitiformis TaxID=36881 RepID=A0AAE0ENE6_9CHLO|nr:hypothetical protein CYMTET_55616 [Cymbomonas tetramitiformis]
MAQAARGTEVSRLQKYSSIVQAGQLQRVSGGPVRLKEQRGGPARRLGGEDMARAARGAEVNRLERHGSSASAVQAHQHCGKQLVEQCADAIVQAVDKVLAKKMSQHHGSQASSHPMHRIMSPSAPKL